jgi:hypothetical protein
LYFDFKKSSHLLRARLLAVEGRVTLLPADAAAADDDDVEDDAVEYNIQAELA